LVSFAIAALLAWYFSKPIGNLKKAFKLVAEGRLETRIGQSMQGRHDELSDLGYGFDAMAGRLQNLVEGQQRLLHDVSHELRSPLARLQAALDLVQQQPDRAIEFYERIERESKRMDRLIEELLTLARLEAGLPGNRELAIDLAELIDTIAEDAAFEASRKPCEVKVVKDKGLQMIGNPDLMHRAIENIVRNAIRHTPEGSAVIIQCSVNYAEQRIAVSILDQGKGMPESDLNAVFEPFFRGESSIRFSGYGLGMAITKRIVTAHRGRVSAENRKEGGLKVTIELPLATSRSDHATST
jgi:signal transduction histidine kinase